GAKLERTGPNWNGRARNLERNGNCGWQDRGLRGCPMPLILSLTFAVGLLLVFLSATTGWTPVRDEQPRRAALRAFLDRNGAGQVGVRDFVLFSAATGTTLALA